jgi:hypothetical protein
MIFFEVELKDTAWIPRAGDVWGWDEGPWDLFSFFGEETTTPIATKREFGRHPPKMKPK